MTEEKLGLERRRPEKTMNLSQREISWGWGQKGATGTQFSMEIQPDEAQHSHPEQHAIARVNGLNFQLLSVEP
jgi:hypothetical protein